VRQTNAVSTHAAMPKTSQASAAARRKPTSSCASRPLATMPAPGPANIKPPSDARPIDASRARHQPDE